MHSPEPHVLPTPWPEDGVGGAVRTVHSAGQASAPLFYEINSGAKSLLFAGPYKARGRYPGLGRAQAAWARPDPRLPQAHVPGPARRLGGCGGRAAGPWSQEDSIALRRSTAGRVPARVLGKASSFVFSFRITITTSSLHLLSIKNILYNDKPLK